jgi:hypothetical protein
VLLASQNYREVLQAALGLIKEIHNRDTPSSINVEDIKKVNELLSPLSLIEKPCVFTKNDFVKNIKKTNN